MKKYEDLYYFYKLTNILLSQFYKFNTKLNKSLKIILEYAQSEIGSIMILKEEKYLEVVASTNLKILNKRINIENEKSPAIKAFKLKKYIKKKLPVDEKNRYNCKNFVIFPIISKKKTLGVLNITKKINDKDYTEREIKVIQKFINSIAILIENAILEENLEKEKEKLKKLNEELIQLQRLKEKFIYLIVHDFKTPLAQIISNLDLLSHDKNLPESAFEIIDSALVGCEDLNRMILNLLDIYKIKNNSLIMNKTKENIVKILDESIEKFTSYLKIKEQRLIKKYEHEECMVLIDKELIIRVFNNLIHNAIKYSPKGESIIIKVKCYKNYAVISIKNTGIGIDEKFLKNIFNLFFSIETASGSSGIGLSFCKLAIELMNGKIEVKSKKDKWTEFKIYIPIEKTKEINKKIFNIEL